MGKIIAVKIFETRTAKFTLNLLLELVNYEKESYRSKWSDIAHIGQIGKPIFRIYKFGYLHRIQCLDLDTNCISNFLKRPISVYRFLKPTYRSNPDSGLLGIIERLTHTNFDISALQI